MNLKNRVKVTPSEVVADCEKYYFNAEDKQTLEIIVKHSRPNQHQEKIIQAKRPVIYQAVGVPSNFGAYNFGVIQDLINKNVISADAVKRIGLFSSNLKNNKDMFLICNQDFAYYKAYNPHTTNKDDKHKSPYGLKKIIFNIEKINESTEHVVLGESTEKGQAKELILDDPFRVCVGLHGIQTKLTDDILEKLKGKKVSILFDRRQDETINTERERFNAVLRALECLKITKDVSICEIPNLNQDLDIDDYLELFDISDRKDKLLDVLEKNSFSVKAYMSLYNIKIDLSKKDDTRRKRLTSIYKKKIIDSPKTYETRQQVSINSQALINKNIEIDINPNHKKAVCLSGEAGTGKTEIVLKVGAKRQGGKSIYITGTIQLCDEVLKRATDKEIKTYKIDSNLSYCKSNHKNNILNLTLDTDYKTDENNQHIFKRVKRYEAKSSKNYDTKDICNSCPIKSSCKNTIHRQEGYLNSDSNFFIMTLAKYKQLMKNKDFRKYLSDNFLSIIFDEKIADLISDKKEIKFPEFNSYITSLEHYQATDKLNEDQVKALDVLKEIYKYKNRLFSLQSKDVMTFLKVENQTIFDLINSINISKLELEYNTDLDTHNIENKDNKDKRLDHVSKTFLYDVISAIKSKNNNKVIYFGTYEFTILEKNDFDSTLDLLYIFLDASTHIDVISHLTGISKSDMDYYKPDVKKPKLKVCQVYNSTFGNQYFNNENNISKLADFINSNTSNTQTSLITANKGKTKELKSNLSVINEFLYYGSEAGRNDLSSYDNNFVFNPSTHESFLEIEMQVLFDRVPHNKLEFTKTNILLEDNTYLEIENRVYTDDLLEKYNHTQRQDKIYQGGMRIYRGYENTQTEKTIYIFSDLDMSKYFENIIPMELKDIDYRQSKTKQAEIYFKDKIKDSLIKDSIIVSNNFKKNYLSKIAKNTDNLEKPENIKTCNQAITQLCKRPYELLFNPRSALLQLDSISIDDLLLDIKSTFDISDRNFKDIQSKVFNELKIKAYYLAGGKQGLFYSNNESIANQVKNFFKENIATASTNLEPDNIIDAINDITLSYTDNDINDNVNVPTEIFKPVNDQISVNSNIDNSAYSTVQDIKKENIAFSNLNNVPKVTIKEQNTPGAGPTSPAENIELELSYDEYIDNNLEDLLCRFNLHIKYKAEHKIYIDDKQIQYLDNEYQEAITKGYIEKSYYYKFLKESILSDIEGVNNTITDMIRKTSVLSLISIDNIDYKNIQELNYELNNIIDIALNYQSIIDVADIEYNSISSFNYSLNSQVSYILNTISIINLKDISYTNIFMQTYSYSDTLNNILKTASYFDCPDMSDIYKIEDYQADIRSQLIIERISNLKSKNVLNQYLDSLKKNKKLITDDTLIKIKMWLDSSQGTKKYNERKFLYLNIRIYKNEYNSIIKKYIDSLKIQV